MLRFDPKLLSPLPCRLGAVRAQGTFIKAWQQSRSHAYQDNIKRVSQQETTSDSSSFSLGAFLTTWLVGQSNVFDVALCAQPGGRQTFIVSHAPALHVLGAAEPALCLPGLCQHSACAGHSCMGKACQQRSPSSSCSAPTCTAQYTVCQVEPIHFHASCVPCPCCSCAPCAAYCSMCCADCLTPDCAHVMAVAVILVLSSCPSSPALLLPHGRV